MKTRRSAAVTFEEFQVNRTRKKSSDQTDQRHNKEATAVFVHRRTNDAKLPVRFFLRADFVQRTTRQFALYYYKS